MCVCREKIEKIKRKRISNDRTNDEECGKRRRNTRDGNEEPLGVQCARSMHQWPSNES